MHKYILFLVLFPWTNPSMCQSDMIGAGHSISFDGTDDLVDLGDVYDDLTLPISISAWIKIDSPPSYLYPIFNSQDNLPIYNGVTLAVSATSISIQYGDGRGEGSSAFRRGRGASIPDITGRWVHIAANMRSASDMDLFVNGVNVGGFYDGTSPLPMSSNSSGDVAKIGYWHSNGSNYFFKGEIDELRFWNKPLSENEIRSQMCKKLSGNETGLIGYWTFDETSGSSTIDKSSNHFNGTLIGNPTRVYSGAPIGDESNFLYPASWSGQSISFIDGTTSVMASEFTNNPPGAHIYKVTSAPSQTNGLVSGEIKSPYFGVFTALLSGTSSFSISSKENNIPSCKIKGRADNSVSNWAESSLTGIQNRLEFIAVSSSSDLEFSLGQDIITCDQSVNLSTSLDPLGKSFLWNTGETSSTINVKSSGNYSVLVTEGCKAKTDEIEVLFSDPVAITADKIPNVITPNNGDELNQYFIVHDDLLGSSLSVFNRWGKLVYDNLDYQNDWDGSNLDFGIYFYLIRDRCQNEAKGVISIIR